MSAVAGRFYSADVAQLRHQVQRLLFAAKQRDAAVQVRDGQRSPAKLRAIVVPHAAYAFSGEVAAQAYQLVASHASDIKRVVVIGPSHRPTFIGCALPQARHFNSPLGDIPIDQAAKESLNPLRELVFSDEAHREEHSLEVQLPFLQLTLNEFTLLPMLIGRADPAKVITLLESVWQDDTLLVVSSDLSHYLNYDDAVKTDLATCRQIESMALPLTTQQACGAEGINALVALTQRRDYTLERILLRNSGDVPTGHHERVVGYASYAVWQ
uniref:AmmeMemoRadiSam system protein B n=1 Tax=Thaumasiovibrio occultus TaxID=1891184 RepID=UPI000B3517F7|nr:AmmeMemoRadiSam system protein B [Thaumasiovibrio occultus]